MPAAGRGGSWLRSHKWWVAGGVGLAAVGGLALYERSKGSSSTAGSSSSPTDTVTPAGAVSYDDTSGDYDSLESQVATLQSAVSAAQTSANSADTLAQSATSTNSTQQKQINSLLPKKKTAKKTAKKTKATRLPGPGGKATGK